MKRQNPVSGKTGLQAGAAKRSDAAILPTSPHNVNNFTLIDVLIICNLTAIVLVSLGAVLIGGAV